MYPRVTNVLDGNLVGWNIILFKLFYNLKVLSLGFVRDCQTFVLKYDSLQTIQNSIVA